MLVQVLGAAGLVKGKGATACMARPSVCDDLAKGFIGVGTASKWAQTQLRLARCVKGGARVLLGTSALVLEMANGYRWRQRGQMWAERGFCRFKPVFVFIY